MGSDIIVLLFPLILFILPIVFVRLSETSHLASQQFGPKISADSLDQLTMQFIIYFILFLVPIGGKLIGAWGQMLTLAALFTVLVSLLIRFKKLSDG